jgi:hypothetical protein
MKSVAERIEPAMGLMCEIAAILQRVHDAHVVHRDIKPENILLMGPRLEPVLADFGICFHEYDDEEAAGERLTQHAGATVGSRDYVAPELVARGSTAVPTGASDLYSLGMTLFALIRGRPAPHGQHRHRDFDLTLVDPDPRLAHVMAVVDQLVASDPAQRPASATAAEQLLTRALTHMRSGARYEPGLYAADGAPTVWCEELVTAVRESRTDPSLVAKTRGIREQGITRARAVWTVSALPVATAEQMDESIRQAAEHLLASTLPLIQAQHPDAVAQVARVAALVDAFSDDTTATVHQHIQQAAAALAASGSAAYAWVNEQWDVVAAVARAYEQRYYRWDFLRGVDPSSSASGLWIRRRLEASAVLRHISQRDGRDPTDYRDTALIGHGIGMLRRVLALTPADAQELVDSPTPTFDWDAMTACYDDNRAWWTPFGAVLTAQRGRDALPSALFGMTEADLRAQFRRKRGVLVRLIRCTLAPHRAPPLSADPQLAGIDRFVDPTNRARGL